ncbi:MAG: bile acid:sodium symporter [Proteobacteria bacterium]|nr:bile acid:sodium symporter [Pseudomonadota bacterium]
MAELRGILESRQVSIYFAAVASAALIALTAGGTDALETSINPALAAMLFLTFLQVPLADLGQAFGHGRFLAALIVTNFVVMPLLVALLVQLLPDDPMLRLGALLVLLSPCIDYVVTFSHLGRADARLLLAATPVLLILQILLLPVYLQIFLEPKVAELIDAGPFVQAFVWLIAIPFAFAALLQYWAARNSAAGRLSSILGLLPVPATAIVLFVVVAAVVPELRPAIDKALSVVPIYLGFAILAPLIGWRIARLFRLDAPAGRAVAFSAATRNSLVILPLGLAIPGAVPVLPAIIVTQTLIELLSELVYVRLMPKLSTGREAEPA